MLQQKYIWQGKEYTLQFYDSNDFESLEKSKIVQVLGVCFYDDKLVLGLSDKNEWGLLGGKPEPGETYLHTLEREVKEESNMKLLKAWPIGYQIVKEEGTVQLRYACKVDKIGEFKTDPAGGVVKIAVINLEDYKEYLKWGVIGDHIISKASKLTGIH